MSNITRLEEATKSNKLFDALENQWSAYISTQEDDLTIDEYLPSLRENAKRLFESPEDGSKVCILMHGEACEAFMHVNYVKNIKGHSEAVVRMPWFHLAPRFDYEDISNNIIASTFASLFESLVLEANSYTPTACCIKVYLRNMYDADVIETVANLVIGEEWEVKRKGSWLHFDRR